MKTLAGLLVVVLLLLSTVANGQEEYPALSAMSYNHFGSGARALAMGNAFVGLSNDVSSGSWNPAGLWVIENPVVAGTYFLYTPKGEFTDSRTPGATADNLDVNSLGSFSFVTPVRIKGNPWVFNFNYIRNNETTTKASYWSGFESDPPINPNVYLVDKGHLNSYRLGMTTRLYKQLSAGFTVNIYDGWRYTESLVEEGFIQMRYEIPPIPDTLLLQLREADSTGSDGLNFTLGLMYKLEKYSFGAVIHTPFTMNHDNDYQIEATLYRNGLLDDFYSESVYVDDALGRQDIPLTATVGFAAFPKEKLTFTLDLNYQDYSSVYWYTLESFTIDASGQRTDVYDKLKIDWNNSLGIGAGMEYLLDTKYGRLPLRAGLRFDQLPQSKDINANQTYILDQDGDTIGVSTSYSASGRQNEYSFSIGTGVHWAQIELDLAWRYTTGAELNIINRLDGGVVDEMNMKSRAHEFRATMVGHF